MVQTNQTWWNNAKLLKYCDSQEEMDKYAVNLDRESNMKDIDYYWSIRKWLFLSRLWLYTRVWNMHFGFRSVDWTRPGLEVKYACESAEQVGAKL